MYRKFLCLDVDGTIIAKEGDFYAGAKDFCNEVLSLGWEIMLCSSRTINSLKNIVNDLSCINWISGLGGGVIEHKEEMYKWKNIYCSNSLPSEIVKYILNWTMMNNCFETWIYDINNWYSNALTNTTMREQFITNQEPIINDLSNLNNVIKIVIPNISTLLYNSLKSYLKFSNLILHHSSNSQIEILQSLSYSKGITTIRDYFNDDNVFFISIGDGENDVGMFKSSNISMTFDDSKSFVKNHANIILSKDREIAYKKIINIFKFI